LLDTVDGLTHGYLLRYWWALLPSEPTSVPVDSEDTTALEP